MSDKVKPCPFCGGRPDLSFEHSSEHPDWWKVTCVECGNRTASNTTSKATAIYNWNTRAALAQPQNDAEAVAFASFDDAGQMRHLTEKGRINGLDYTPLYTAPLSAELKRMRKALEAAHDAFESIRSTLIKELDEPARTAFWQAVGGRNHVHEALRAGDNHASDGRESEINEAPLCKKCGHHATSERVLACGSSCQMRPSDPTPAQERREEIARIIDPMFRDGLALSLSEKRTENALAKADAILALPPAPKGEPSQEWKPIETAPRNLVVMLAWSPDDWTVGQGFYRGDRWVACGCFFNLTLPHPGIEVREMYPEPTHWQHIPGPPALRRRENGDG